ncbi:MAG: Fic family protein [Alphaproteobacteria bacterium]
MNLDLLTDKKKRLDAFRPLPEPLVRNLEDWFRVELTYTSNAIEGNTLTRQETALVVEKGLTVGGKTLTEHLEATNHAHALDWVSGQVKRSPSQLTEKDILHLHNIVLKGIDDANAGHYRAVSVRISGSTVVLPNPRKVPELMATFETWLAQCQGLHPVEFAVEAHYRLVTIHPFVDGNGRCARLLMNMMLLMCGYPAAIIRKRDRLAYINSLEKAQLGGAKDDYFKLMFKGVDRSLDIYLKAAAGQDVVPPKKERLFKIGELAKHVVERNSTLRHWTKQGLLRVAEVTPTGYQLYAPEMIERVKTIKALQRQRFTLQEIKEKLDEGFNLSSKPSI